MISGITGLVKVKDWAKWIKAILIVLAIGLGSVPLTVMAAKPEYPVIFVHGLGLTSEGYKTWDSFTKHLKEDLGWTDGGMLQYDFSAGLSVTSCMSSSCDPANGDFYTVNFTSSNQLYLYEQGGQLKAAIDRVLAHNKNKSKVILVGHSMGGLAARAYLQGLATTANMVNGISYGNDVAKLITIGTPHQGSSLANLLQALHDTPAGFDLQPAQPGIENGISNLNKLSSLTSLPNDVAFFSIIGLGGNSSGSGDGTLGDGIVTAYSQNMANLAGLPATLNHTEKSRYIFFCQDAYLETYGTSYFLKDARWELHSCETSSTNIWETVINEIVPTYTDTVSSPTVINLQAPTQYSPSNNSSIDISAADVSASWSQISSATSYRIMVSENPADLTTDPNVSTCPNCVINDTTASSSYIISASSLKSGSTYYWRVKARSATQVGEWSASRNFTAMVPPQTLLSAPNLNAPVNGALGQSDVPVMSWSEVYQATSYRIMAADSQSNLITDPTNPICSACVINDVTASPNYTPPAGILKQGKTYYWQVKARSPNGYGTWSSQWNFATAAPVTDTLPPQDGVVTAVAGSGQVAVYWSGYSDASGIASYKVVYSSASAPADCNSGTTLLAAGLTSNFTHTGLSNGTAYYYRVCAIDGSGNQSSGAVANATPQAAVIAGSLRISITPAGAPIIAGAQWKLSTEATWHNSDDTLSDLLAGTYTVQFKPITGWGTPADQSVVVSAGNLSWLNGNAYTPTSGGVTPPSNLQAFPNSDGSMSFTWSDNSNNEDFFNLYYSTSGATGPFPNSIVAGMPTNTTSFTVGEPSFTMGQNYCFRLMAYQNATTLYSYSNIVCGTPNVTTGSLNAPPIVASGENFQIAQKSDGTVWSWGAGSYQQTGYAATGDRSYPGSVLLSDVTKISSGRFHSLAVKPDGRVFAWGGNFNGELGDGTTTWSAPKQVAGLPTTTAIAAGYSHSVAVGSDGTVWAWGSNLNGELGDTSAGRLIPGLVAGLSGVVGASAGTNVTVAVKNDGTVWAWGRNNHGEAGVYGGLNQYSPQRIGAYEVATSTQIPLTDVIKVASGLFHNLALKNDGTVWAWGDGQLGVAGYSGVSTNALRVTGLTNIVDIAVGTDFSVALNSDGTVWTWGGSQTSGQVPGLTGVIAIAAGGSIVTAVKSDGSVVSWGTNTFGQVGDGTTVSKSSPVTVLDSTGSGSLHLFTTQRPFVRVFPKTLSFPATNTDVTSATQAITVVNIGGASADLTRMDISPEFIQSTTCGTTLAAGASCSINVGFAPTTGGAKSGTLTVSHSGTPGYDTVLLSGNGVVANHIINTTSPVAGRGILVGGGTVAHRSYVTVVAIANTGFTFEGWSEDGVVVSTNPVYSFQALGDRTLSASFVPPAGTTGPIVTLSEPDMPFGGQLIGIPSSMRTVTLYNAGLAPLNISSVGITGSTAFVNQTGGANCEEGAVLQVGASCTLSVVFTPTAVGTYSASLSITSNANGSPNVLPLSGVGQPPIVSPRVAVGTTGIHSAALRSDGTLWTWGGGYSGQLGDGANGVRTTPVQIGSGINWYTVSAGSGHTVALQSDGALWAWGNNQAGSLGNGTSTPSNTPLRIGTETNWKTVAAGNAFTLAIKSDGTLWTWGDNTFGQLGIGTTTGTMTPVQVGTATNWSAVAAGSVHSLAIRSDGTLWAWGYNSVGEIGDSTTTTRLSPVQVGTATTWSAVAAGSSHTVALRSDGTLWAWGANSSGQLGDGTQSVRYSPTRIGAASNWFAVSAGSDHTVAIRSDGTLWTWGNNGSGQLGGSTTANTGLSPLQVGAATDWLAAAAGQSHTVALKNNGELWSWGSNTYGQLGRSTPNPAIPGLVVDSAGTGYLSLGLGITQSAGYMLDVSAVGGGTVTSSPAGISCGTTCSASFPTGTVVMLTATPNGSSTFAGWTGGCSGTGICTVTMDNAKSITASFPLNTYNVTPSAGLGGTISPATVSTVNYGSTALFTLTPNAHYHIASANGCGGTLSGNIFITSAITADCSVASTFAIDDTTAPTGAISINSGGASTNSTTATLTLSCADTSGCSEMQFSNDNSTWSTAEAYATSKIWTLTSGDSTKTVYAKFKDVAGNWSTAYSDTIVLDTTVPATTASPAGGTYNLIQSVTLTCSDGTGSGCDKIYYSTDGTTPTTASTVYSTAISISATKTLKFFAKDLAGNSETVKSEAYTIDTVSPVLTLSTLSNNSVTNNPTLNISGTVTDNTGIQSLTVNGNAVAVNTDGSFSHVLVLNEGANAITTVATDLAGNQTTDTRTITLDTTAPTLAIFTPADNSKTAASIATVTGTIDETSIVTLTLNGSAPQYASVTGSTFTLDIVLASGINTIEVTATDTAGNTSTQSTQKRTVTYDPDKPSLAITDPAQDIKTNQGSAIIKGTVSDTLTAVSVSVIVDGNTYTPTLTNGLFEQAITFTTEKTYTVTVTATDEVGNTTTVQRNIIYDITQPAIDFTVTTPTNNTSQTIPGTMEEGSMVTVTSSTATVGAVTYPSATTWSVNVTGMTEGSNTITATAKDTAGNETTVAKEIVVDTIAPVTSATPVGGTYNLAQAVTLAANETAAIYYSMDGSVPSIIYTSPISIVYNKIALKFFAVDLAGNSEAVKAEVYTINSDTNAPEFSSTSPASGSSVNTASVGYSLSKAVASGKITFTRTGGTADSSPHVYNFTSSDLAAGTHSINTGLSLVNGTVYTVTFEATDSAGKTGSVSSTNVTYDSSAASVTIISPAANSITNIAKVNYALSEDISAGDIVFTKTGGASDSMSPYTYTLSASEMTVGNHTVDTGKTLMNGSIYTVSFENIKDKAGNFTATVSNTDVKYDITAVAITNTTPAANSIITGPTVSYALSEQALSGKITFTRTGGTADGSSPHVYNLTASDLTSGNHTVNTSIALADGAFYTVSFDATGLVGNPATTVSNAMVYYDSNYGIGPTGNVDNTSYSIKRVDGYDLIKLSMAFGSKPGDANWNPVCDINKEGLSNNYIDGLDITTLGKHFGEVQ